jgi:SAM-dependent methyltransferase
MTSSGAYHDTRLRPDPRREIVWKALWRYHFCRIVPADGCVLDIGCGYGGFINHVVARQRIALDAWPDFPEYLDAGVEALVGDVIELRRLPDRAVDFAFASNLFEHLSQASFAAALDILRAKLSPRGTLTILQPNYRYAYREYFDDYTHVAVYSHISLADFLAANGYQVMETRPRFLPLTIKSRLPIHPALIAAYLKSPIKPLAKQMFLRAQAA